jgi:cell division protein FtsQ
VGGRLLALVAVAALTTTLAAALQIRRIDVEGARRFPASDVEAALLPVLGRSMLSNRPDALRDVVRELPWVADARVRVSLDGVVVCEVTERTPIAVAVDGDTVVLLDADGRTLGSPHGEMPPLVIAGFAPFPDERRLALEAAAALGLGWGSEARRMERLGPRDVLVVFEDQCVVIVDPARAGEITAARRVHDAWLAAYGQNPRRLDARIGGRVAVLPALPAPTDGETE